MEYLHTTIALTVLPNDIGIKKLKYITPREQSLGVYLFILHFLISF